MEITGPGLAYLTFLAAAMCAAYALIFAFFPIFFRQLVPPLHKNSLCSIISIVILTAIFFSIAFVIHDAELGDRFLHAIGGGFLAFYICYRAARDSGVCMSRFQFFILSALIVTALGVANELAEFALQEITGLPFAPSIVDTWLDLLSNTTGIFLASTLLVPLFKSTTGLDHI